MLRGPLRADCPEKKHIKQMGSLLYYKTQLIHFMETKPRYYDVS